MASSDRTSERRPDPDTLLAIARKAEERERKGRLRVFFGAAPGVGKTYSMLEEARARRSDGTDVAVGLVETHGRAETEALLYGLEILPRRHVDYKDMRLPEFDLDAALARRPGLLLVDELAHTNAPGSRHLKRWQDVRELLDQGIDVYTTVNVQHIESLNDLVAQITGVRVRETVPDSFLEAADALVMVDLPLEDLLERLKQGKVYVPAQAEWAARNFFRSGNIIALRELALRFIADRINTEVLVYREGHAIETTWPTAERLLVCVGPSPTSARLVRSAKRMAVSLHAPWIAAFVEAPQVSEQQRGRAMENLRLAENLGAEILHLKGSGIAEEIVALARSRNVSRIIIGKPVRWRLLDFFLGSPVDDLVRRSGEIDVHVIRGSDEAAGHGAGGGEAAGGRTEDTPSEHGGRSSWRDYGLALGCWAGATALAFAMFPSFQLSNLIMVYLLGVVVAAVACGRGPSFLTAVASVLSFDFFFVPPRFTFAVSDTQYVVTFVIMLVVALIISHLTTLMRRHARTARGLERHTGMLLSLSRRLAEARGTARVVAVAERAVSELLECRCMLLVAEEGGRLTRPRGGHGGKQEGFSLDDRELGAAQWVFANGRAAGRGTDTLPEARSVFLPLFGRERTVGVLAARPVGQQAAFLPVQQRLLDSFAKQIALALEVERLQDAARTAQMESEAERLKASLLSSVTHDLRTPLAAIMGSAESLLAPHAGGDPETARMLAANIHDEAARLSRLLGNLLRLTKIESKAMELHEEPTPVEEVVGAALAAVKSLLGERRVDIDIAPDLPMAPMDGTLVEQMLANLLENAAKYTPPDSPVSVSARLRGDFVELSVADRGPGLPPGDPKRLFDIFQRGPAEAVRGDGLGLAICRAVAAAHGGSIRAENRPGGGAIFTAALPLAGHERKGGRRP